MSYIYIDYWYKYIILLVIWVYLCIKYGFYVLGNCNLVVYGNI